MGVFVSQNHSPSAPFSSFSFPSTADCQTDCVSLCLQMSETGRSLHRQPLQARGHLPGPLVLAAVPVRRRLHGKIL